MPTTLNETMDIMKAGVQGRNVSQWERVASAIGGGALVAYGIKKGSWAGLSLAAVGGSLLLRGTTGQCGVYKALGINTSEDKYSDGTSVPYELGIRVDRSVTVNKSPEELFQFWRNLENLPKFMNHLKEVRQVDERRSHWVAKAPAGFAVEWEAEIINEIENKLIGWRSLEGSDVDNAGSVHFDALPNGRGTEVRVSLQYNPPAGQLGAAIARLFGEEPNQQITEDLRRFKQLMETGEIPTTEGQTSGREKSPERSMKPGQQWDRDKVMNSSEESFPASDPPSFTPQAL